MTDFDVEAKRRARTRRIDATLGWVWVVAALPVTALLGGVGALVGFLAGSYAVSMIIAAVCAVVLHWVVKARLYDAGGTAVPMFFVTIGVLLLAVAISVGGLAADANDTVFGFGVGS